MEVMSYITEQDVILKCENEHEIYSHVSKIETVTCYECTIPKRRNMNLLDYIKSAGPRGEYLGVKDENGNFVIKIPGKISHTDAWYRCSKGHDFKTSFFLVRKGKWCTVCLDNGERTIAEYDNICKRKVEYMGVLENNEIRRLVPHHTSEPSHWKCKTCGLIFQSNYEDIIGGKWCPVCPRNVKKTVQHYHLLLEIVSRDGKYMGAVNAQGVLIADAIPKNTLSKDATWMCNVCGTMWRTSYNTILYGAWCPCCTKSRYDKTPFTIEDYHKVCDGKGYYMGAVIDGEVHPDKIPNNMSCTNARWICETCLTEFNTAYHTIQSGCWCKKCSGYSKRTLDDYHELPEKLGYNLIYMGVKLDDGSYDNTIIPPNSTSSTAHWKCCDCGYERPGSFDSIAYVIQNSCPKCSCHTKKSVEDYDRLLIERGIDGKYLGVRNGDSYSRETVDSKSKSCWLCNVCGTEFERAYVDVKSSYFCRQCLSDNIIRNNSSAHVKRNLEEYIALPNQVHRNGSYLGLEQEGGTFLLEIPRDARHKASWKCNDCGMVFQMTYFNIKIGCWCQFCNKKSEAKLMRFLLEHFSIVKREYTNELFRITQKKMLARFDFYLEHNGHKVLIEIDGGHHFIQVWNWKSPDYYRERDTIKVLTALNNGYRVVRIFEDDVRTDKIIDGEPWQNALLNAIQTDDSDLWFLASNLSVYSKHIQDLGDNIK
jgi:very-short-patch-repair endonuclease